MRVHTQNNETKINRRLIGKDNGKNIFAFVVSGIFQRRVMQVRDRTCDRQAKTGAAHHRLILVSA